MYDIRSKVFWFAIISRISIILLQIIFNGLCPDHHSDGFKTPQDPKETFTFFDNLINFAFGGLVRWDSHYFMHIARYGYTYENTLAFFPLYPMSIRVLSRILKKILLLLNDHSIFIFSGVFLSFVCFVKSSLIFYDLSRHVLKDKNIAYKAAILYCISPASIFFTATYSESMFAYLTFYSMLAAVKNNPFVSLPIGLSGIVRSNGLVNIGYPIYIFLQDLFFVKIVNIINDIKNQSIKSALPGIFNTFGSIINISCTVLLSLAPFCLLQTYNFVHFCTEKTNSSSAPAHIIKYGVDNDFILPGVNLSPWCTSGLPMAYSYVQKKYWNVGFFSYYEIKQLPNFVLALPILYIMLKCTFEYYLENKSEILTLNIFRGVDRHDRNIISRRFTPEMLPFVVHGLFLTIFCILFVHIQVSTRLLASASPIMYWYCAILMSRITRDDFDDRQNMLSRWRVFFMTQKRYTKSDQLILIYFLGYSVIGTFMYSNFLPWT